MLILKNSKIITMAGHDYRLGDIAIEGSKIKSIGKNLPVSDFDKVIDCTGKTILPGFIEAHSKLGIVEDGSLVEGDDSNEYVNPITPHLRAIDAINPMDITLAEAYQGGVTTVCTCPGSSNVIGGIASIIKTYGHRIDDMLVNKTFALKVAFGEDPKSNYISRKSSPVTRMAIAGMLRQQFYEAINYQKKRSLTYENVGGQLEYDMKNEILLKVLSREIPIIAHANRMDDIHTAMRVAREFNLRMILVQCSEAHLMTEEIKKAGYPIVLRPMLTGRPSIETANMSHCAPAILEHADITFCISTDAPTIPAQFLPTSAGCAVRDGLSSRKALEAITIKPAQVLGIANRVGSLEVGKDADIVVYNGKPFNLMSRIEMVLIDGNIVHKA